MAMHYLDMLGEICPHPLHMTKAKVDEIQSGDILIVESDYSGSVKNILAWADRAGHKYDVEEVEEGVWQVKITKK